jgi:hypothetical protein
MAYKIVKRLKEKHPNNVLEKLSSALNASDIKRGKPCIEPFFD